MPGNELHNENSVEKKSGGHSSYLDETIIL